MALRYIGESVTDSNGLAVLPDGYTGTGAGEIDVVAKTEIDDSIFQSEPYPVLDAKHLFTGTSYISSAGRITDNGDGSYTLDTDGTNYNGFNFATSNSSSGVIYANIGECFEFDLIEYSGTIALRNNIQGGSNRNVNTSWENNTHYKIEIIENGVKFNGTTKTFADNGARAFILRIETEASFKIKNLVHY